MKKLSREQIIILLVTFILGAIAFLAWQASGNPAPQAERRIVQRLKLEIRQKEAENRLLKRQISDLRRLCYEAGISDQEIKKALKPKPTAPEGKPEYPAIGKLNLGMTVEFPCQYEPLVINAQKDYAIAILVNRILPQWVCQPAPKDSEERPIDRYLRNCERIVIKGIETKNLTSNKYIELEGRFKIAATQNISTKYGSETVFVLEKER